MMCILHVLFHVWKETDEEFFTFLKESTWHITEVWVLENVGKYITRNKSEGEVQILGVWLIVVYRKLRRGSRQYKKIIDPCAWITELKIWSKWVMCLRCWKGGRGGEQEVMGQTLVEGCGHFSGGEVIWLCTSKRKHEHYCKQMTKIMIWRNEKHYDKN